MIRKAMPKISPFGGAYVLNPPNRSTRLRWGIGNLLFVERVTGGEFHANRSTGRWRWLFRNVWRPEVIEIPEGHFRHHAWRTMLRYGLYPGPDDVHDVVDATKFFCLNPQFRPGENGRLFPDIWTGKFLPAYEGPDSLLNPPDQDVVHQVLFPGRQQAPIRRGRIIDNDAEPISRGTSPTLAVTNHPNHESENRNDPTPTSAPRPAQSTGNGNRIFSPARSYDFPN
ncbi:hypothetical protein Pan97_34820 [Bremerella volcania]|uniref:Uncharacterized protein n=1 Tax=Bremerella volcania TaxID=2527984 RepID=A0A518CB28_9BACT|nr:hypothetical protein Pan97_34820 [Bremerella volcania]